MRKRRTPEIVAGKSGSATPPSGPGFTVTRTAAGTFDVKFDKPLPMPVFVIASVEGAAYGGYSAYAANATPYGFTAYTGYNAAASDLIGFQFIAVGGYVA